MRRSRLAQGASNSGMRLKPSTHGSTPTLNGLLKTSAQSILRQAVQSSQLPKPNSTLASKNSLEMIKVPNTLKKSCSERMEQLRDGDNQLSPSDLKLLPKMVLNIWRTFAAFRANMDWETHTRTLSR